MKSASYIDFYSGTIDSAHYPVSQQHHPFTTPTQQSQTFEQSTYNDSAIISQALALLTTTDEACMNNYFNAGNPNINFQSSFPTSLPLAYDGRQDSVISAGYTPAYDWQMYQMSMGAPVASTQQRGLKRQRSHQRTPSASTVASNGPASPYATNTSYPQIANTDFSPNSPAHYADTSFYQKDLPTPQQTPTQASFMPSGYIPSQAAHLPNAHLAMKDFGIHHHLADDFTPDFYHSSRHSMSSGHESPATPHSGVGDQPDLKTYNMAQNDFNRQPNPNVQLWRTESSQAYQDELYNPSVQNTTPPAPKRLSQQHLSPHRNLVHDRLQTANLVRSASPTSAVSRERSPFRDGSPLAPTGDWSSHVQNVGTAAGMRQQQKQQAEQAELDYHRPALQREPTKTMSPQDAMLEYTDGEQPSLFQDSVPAGYRQHTGGTDAWSSNDFTNQVGSTFGNLSAGLPNQQQMGSFRATSADGWNEANFGSYIPLPPANQDQNTQIQGTPFQQNTFSAPRMTYSEATPDFPATLTSMESSVSEGGPPLSSQESFSASGPQRPNDTRANTGTYTCTYHGCTQRFDTHINLQKHKRDYHRSQQQKDATSNETDSASASARSTESPAPSGSGLTSAAILARNSQAGPHKCTRINPSTNKPCNTIFSRPYDLTRHEDTIHNGRKQKVRCPYCREEKTFSRNDALTRHMRVVHPEVSEAFGKRSRRAD